jgi:hypothetical protein
MLMKRRNKKAKLHKANPDGPKLIKIPGLIKLLLFQGGQTVFIMGGHGHERS